MANGPAAASHAMARQLSSSAERSVLNLVSN